MAIFVKLPDLGKAFEAFKGDLRAQSGQDDIPASLFQQPRIEAVRCLACKSSYQHEELVKIYERGNQECYPFRGCPTCLTDDYLT